MQKYHKYLILACVFFYSFALSAQTKTMLSDQEIDQAKEEISQGFDEIFEMFNDSTFTNMFKEIDINDRIRYRYQVSTVNDRCVAGALKLVKASGGSTVYLGNEITNKFLDIMMTQVHVANISDPFAMDYGSSFLGIETENLML